METALQLATLQELEGRIEAGLATFIDVGLCLLEIRDRRLYKDKGYTRFEDYCREQWGWSSRHVNRQIEAAETAVILGPIGPIPQTESQARELTPLVKADEQEAVAVWQELKREHGDNITAGKIRLAVREKLKPEEEIVLPKPHVSYNSGNNEWYTPPEYIDAASEVMGAIDLDPASSHKANEIVGAIKYYTAEDDGLKQEWFGRIWMNPPYATELITKFCEKMARYYTDGKVTEAIILVNNATETNWFNILIEQASAVVFPKSRIKFYMTDGTMGQPLQGQAIIYLGGNAEVFLGVFRRFGWGAIP